MALAAVSASLAIPAAPLKRAWWRDQHRVCTRLPRQRAGGLAMQLRAARRADRQLQCASRTISCRYAYTPVTLLEQTQADAVLVERRPGQSDPSAMYSEPRDRRPRFVPRTAVSRSTAASSPASAARSSTALCTDSGSARSVSERASAERKSGLPPVRSWSASALSLPTISAVASSESGDTVIVCACCPVHGPRPCVG